MFLGEIIKKYRIEHDLSQRDFSKLSGLSYTYISALEKNKDYRTGKPISPTLETVRDVAKGMNVPIDDLLKILDNHTSSSIKSRFNNKVFNGYLIIITSSVPLSYWYLKLKSSVDSLIQLYRRINCYVEITKEFIKVYDEGVDDNGHPRGEINTFFNDLLQTKKEKTSTNKISDVFKEISKLGG